jgi:protein-disulfide isomerase
MTTGRKAAAHGAAPAVATRRQRRAAQRAERTSHRTGRNSPKQAWWRSPIVALTVAALVLGGAVVAYALANQPRLATETLAAPVAAVPANLSDGRSLGAAAAPVTLDVWSDFQCPGCRQLATRIEPSIISQFVVPGFTRLVYHDAAFQGRKVASTWDESEQAAAGARCAADQGRFWEMHDWLFANWNGENAGAFAPARLRAIAQSAELDMSAYDACMATGNAQKAARAETDQAVAQGINQTPTIMLNGAIYTGPITVKDLGDAIMVAAAERPPAGTQPATARP